jgi:hypothetical protein
LLLWAIDRKKILWMALAIGLGFLTGRPQVHVLSLLVGVAYAALRITQAWRESGRLPVSDAVAVGMAFGIGFCLGAAQILPTLCFVQESSREGGTVLGEWQHYTLSARHLRQMLVPGSFPDGWPEACSYPTIFVYAGVCAGLVRLFVARRGSRTDSVFWLLLAAVSLYVAFGGPGVYALSQDLPMIRSFRVPARFAYVASFAGLVVAVLAWHRMLASRENWSWLLLGIVSLDGTVAALAGRHTVVASAYDQRDETGSPRRYFSDSLWISPPEIEHLDKGTVERMFASLPPTRNLAMRYGLRSVQGYGEPCFEWFPKDKRRISPGMFRQFGAEILILDVQVDHPDLASIGSGPNWSAYRLRRPLPRAQIVYKTIRAKNREEAFMAASGPGFDPRREVFVDEDVPPVPSDVTTPGSVRVRSETTHRLVLEVDSAQPGYLVLFDTWAPGWSVTVDQAERPVRRANGLFRLVDVPAGHSVVEFEYLPPGFVGGLVLGILGVVASILIALRGARARRSRGYRS